jgi:hypothetical protein
MEMETAPGVIQLAQSVIPGVLLVREQCAHTEKPRNLVGRPADLSGLWVSRMC